MRQGANAGHQSYQFTLHKRDLEYRQKWRHRSFVLIPQQGKDSALCVIPQRSGGICGWNHPKARHLDRSRAASSRGAAERPLYFAFVIGFVLVVAAAVAVVLALAVAVVLALAVVVVLAVALASGYAEASALALSTPATKPGLQPRGMPPPKAFFLWV